MEFFKPFLAFVCIENDVWTPQDTSGHLRTPHDPSKLLMTPLDYILRTLQNPSGLLKTSLKFTR